MLKGTISDHQFQTSLFFQTFSDHQFQTSLFFPNIQIFWHIQKELHCNDLPIQQLSWKHLFWERETFFVVGN